MTMKEQIKTISYPKLDVKSMIAPILRNYNRHVLNLYSILKNISCELIYDGPDHFRDHIRDKTVYACSVRYCKGVGSKKKNKILKSVFPIMIGSNLDVGVRKMHMRTFSRSFLKSEQQEHDLCFETADIACTFFVINGCVRQLPYFFTNDPTNTHVVKHKIVRCYTYDRDDRGKELSLYMRDDDKHKQGDLVVVLNDGAEKLLSDARNFFDRCPHAVDQDAYMSKVFRDGNFDIDHLGNKIVISPGHLFVKLFVKYLYRPLKDQDWIAVKSKHAMVCKSIESGTLLHVLSRKTLFAKEPNSAPKMVTVPQENHREIGVNGEVYVEKNTGCYREVSMQTYPLNPYLSHLIVRQISSKVKKGLAVPFHPSYVGFLCILGSMETKNIGRTHMMVRNVFVSTCEDVDKVYRFLNLDSFHASAETTTTHSKVTIDTGGIGSRGNDVPISGRSGHYVVVNEACVPVSEARFRSIDPKELKRRFRYIECYRDKNFWIVRYKAGLLFKKISVRDGGGQRQPPRHVWVTSRDETYWTTHPHKVAHHHDDVTFDAITSYLTDINPFFKYNMFPKNLLAFNTMKNAVLGTDNRYCLYFMETSSAISVLSPWHRVLCAPVDVYSAHFVLRVPLINMAYVCHKGMNMEDCIVVDKDLRVFDCVRHVTLRIRFEPANGRRHVSFNPMRGENNPDFDVNTFVGHLVCHDDNNFEAVPQTTNVKLERIARDEQECVKIYKIYFSKPNFRIVEYDLTPRRLSVSLEQLHVSETGDKLCTFHGQKGVIRTVDSLPTLDGRSPDILVNPYSLFRMTLGQIAEGVYWGGRDAHVVRNSDGREVIVDRDGLFMAKTLYFPVAYWSSEHIYAPRECVIDKILSQAVKGRSRGGAMRLGNMEVTNGLRGNGLASCFEEKVLEHGDRIFQDGGPIPKSAILCCEDAKFFKCDIDYRMERPIKRIADADDPQEIKRFKIDECSCSDGSRHRTRESSPAIKRVREDDDRMEENQSPPIRK